MTEPRLHRDRPYKASSIQHRVAALDQMVSEGIRREIYETRQKIIAEFAAERKAVQRRY